MDARFLVMVLVATVAVERSFAITFSSRIIHWLSDEARALSVDGDVSGLRRLREGKSVEYHFVLVRRDLQRQKMKLGGHYKFLFPSEGSNTVSFGNDFGWLHYTWIDVGTPNVSFLVALDAGSDYLWLPCNCIQCAPLSASYYGSLDRDLSEYSPAGSSTSKHLSCSHSLCNQGPNCESPKQPCPYTANYYSENTTSSGFLTQDILHLASSSDHGSKRLVQATVIIGCGRKQSGGYLNGIAPDGLMGLGLGDISVPSFLAKSGLTRDSFSMCFNEDDSGRIFFGDQGVGSQHSTPFLPFQGKFTTYVVGVEGFCVGEFCPEHLSFQALVDSGSSFTYLPEKVYEKVTAEFDRKVKLINATRTNFEGSPWDYCYKASSQQLLKIPSMTLVFSVNSSYVIDKPIFQVYGIQGVDGFCLAMQPTELDTGIIGQNFMTGYRLVFDRENLKLRWSRSNCEDLSENTSFRLTPPPHDRPENPLPTNEQQHSPSGEAVSPAVAGRTPINTSSAFSHVIKSLKLLVMLTCLII